MGCWKILNFADTGSLILPTGRADKTVSCKVRKLVIVLCSACKRLKDYIIIVAAIIKQ